MAQYQPASSAACWPARLARRRAAIRESSCTLGRHLGARVAGADHHEGAARVPFGPIIGKVGQLDLAEQVIPQVHRFGQAPEPVRVIGHTGDGQELVDAAQRDHQLVVADRPPVAFRIGHGQLPAAGVDIGDRAQDVPHPAAGGSQRRRHRARVQDPSRHLRQQRQVKEVVGRVNQHHIQAPLSQPPQPAGGVKASKPPAGDDDPLARTGRAVRAHEPPITRPRAPKLVTGRQELPVPG